MSKTSKHAIPGEAAQSNSDTVEEARQPKAHKPTVADENGPHNGHEGVAKPPPRLGPRQRVKRTEQDDVGSYHCVNGVRSHTFPGL